MKTLLFLFTLNAYIYASTPEQVEQYLSVSHAEEGILLLESRYANIQSSFSQNKDTYDMQLLMIRFKEKLQQQLSENEMDKVLKNYNNIVYLQFTSQQITKDDFEISQDAMKALKNDSADDERISIINEINDALNKKDIVGIMYDDLMTPFIKNSIGGNNLSDKEIQIQKDAYIKSILKNSKTEIFYMTKEFTIEELKELLTIVKSSVIELEKKAVYKATAYAFKEFFLSIASRYDLKKHQPKQSNTNNNI